MLTAAALVATVASGCAASKSDLRVAVMPLRAAGVPHSAAKRVRAALSREIKNATSGDVVAPAKVDDALSRACPRQLTPDETCGFTAARSAAATHLIAGAFGAIGKTHVLQLRMTDVARGAVVRSLDETLYGDLAHVERSLAPIVQRLVPAPQPRPWYTRWWVWTIAGAVVTGVVAISLAVALQPGDGVQLP